MQTTAKQKPKEADNIPVVDESDDEEGHIIDKIVDHSTNKNGRHLYAGKGETVYRVRWYGYGPWDDSSERDPPPTP